MRFKKNELARTNGLMDHPKFIAGHIYQRIFQGGTDLYIATTEGSGGDRKRLHSLHNGNVWCSGSEAPFGARGRNPVWKDVTDHVWCNTEDLQ